MNTGQNYSCVIRTGLDNHVALIGGFNTLDGLLYYLAYMADISAHYKMTINQIIADGGKNKIVPVQDFYVCDKLVFPHNAIAQLRLLKEGSREQIERFQALNFTPNVPLYCCKVGKKVAYLQIDDKANILNPRLQERWSNGREIKINSKTPVSPKIMALFDAQKSYNG